jgi:CubicO group peptidase (beta-lactamase class C family)
VTASLQLRPLHDLPPHTAKRPISIRHLLTHTSGISYGVIVMMQTLPFYDDVSMKVYAGVEEAVYGNLK